MTGVIEYRVQVNGPAGPISVDEAAEALQWLHSQAIHEPKADIVVTIIRGLQACCDDYEEAIDEDFGALA